MPPQTPDHAAGPENLGEAIAQVLPEQSSTLWIDYTNHKGEREWRECQPLTIEFEEHLPYHEGLQWVIHVKMFDRDGAARTLALSNIHGFAKERPQAA